VLIVEILYLFSVALLAVYGLNSLLLTWLYRRKNHNTKATTVKPASALFTNYPDVTVQLPIYNERHVVERLIEAAANLDWPTERLQIQILDDSTDDTQHIIAAVLSQQRLKRAQARLDHIRRPNRQGFKAGALQYGLATATGEFIAIFDADFIPPADFLKETIPTFNAAGVGCVQTRWGHVNPESSKLTRAQELGIDGHFIIEQAARHSVQAFLNFNGTAGVWRRSCMADAGGWQGDTLTEDLDLSYRAQFRGWRIVYQAQVVVPAELPVQIDAFKRQQFRWAKGSIQTALKLLGQLWLLHRPLWLKVMGTLHLTNYAVHPLMLLNLLLTLPVTLSNSPLLLLTPFFTMSAIGPPLLYWSAMQGKPLPLAVRLGRLGVLIALGTGLSLNNSRAVLEALLGLDSEFKRTPKFAVTGRSTAWRQSHYILPRDPSAWVELILAFYAWGLLGWAIVTGVWVVTPWLLLYASGYSYIAAMTFVQARQTRAAQARLAAAQGP
jgi:cellulose synthase/poly-beta-1,6-N-acetylglucosamine synthase-like glycosyltransferase